MDHGDEAAQRRCAGRRWLGLMACVLVALAILPTRTLAVDVPTTNPPVEDLAIRQVRSAIGDRNWTRALDLLQRHLQVNPADANGHNLRGYSLRQLGRHAESQVAYERAIALDPAHLGAHEYLGELYLQTGRRDAALQQLRTLARLCNSECEEYRELKQALEASPQRGPDAPANRGGGSSEGGGARRW